MGQSHSHSSRSSPKTSTPPPSSTTPASATSATAQEEPLPPARPRPGQRKQSVASKSLSKLAKRASRLIRPDPEPEDSGRRSKRLSDYIFGTDPNDEFGEFGEFGMRNDVEASGSRHSTTKQKKDKGKGKEKGKGKAKEQHQPRQEGESSSSATRGAAFDLPPVEQPSPLTLLDNDDAEALPGSRTDISRTVAAEPEGDESGEATSNNLSNRMSGNHQTNEETPIRPIPVPPPAPAPQINTTPRAFPPPGTLMVVQGVVHTSDTLPPPPPPPAPATPLTALRNRLAGHPNRATSLPSSTTPAPLPPRSSTPLTEQEEAAAHTNSVDVLSALLGVATAATAAALVTGSTEPLFGASAATANTNNDSQAERANRRQGLWDNLRERVGRRRTAAGTGAGAGTGTEEQGTVEATQNLLTEMANILMGRQEEVNGQTPANGNITPATPITPTTPPLVRQQQATESETSIPSPNGSSTFTPTTAATAGSTSPSSVSPSPSPTPLVPGLTLTPAPLQPDAAPSENFDTFLRQLQSDLRVALMDSYAARRRARTRDALIPDAATPNDIPVPASAPFGADSDDAAVPPPVPESTSESPSAPLGTSDAAGQDAQSPLTPSPPTIEVTPPAPSTQPTAAALGTLNWWRLFRFPAMILQPPNPPSNDTGGAISSTSLPTARSHAASPEPLPSPSRNANTPSIRSNVEDEGEQERQEPKPSSSSSPTVPDESTSPTRPVTTTASGSQADSPSNPPAPSPSPSPNPVPQIVPVIIVGLRSVPAEQAQLLSPPPPPPAPANEGRGRTERGTPVATSLPIPARPRNPELAVVDPSGNDDEDLPPSGPLNPDSAPVTPHGPSAFQWPRAARAIGRHLGGSGNRNRHSMIEGSSSNSGNDNTTARSRTRSLFGPSSGQRQAITEPMPSLAADDSTLPLPHSTTAAPESSAPARVPPPPGARLPTRPAGQETSASAPSSPTLPAPAGRTRGAGSSYVIWVIGGYYPLDHPLVTGADNVFDTFENMWDLADLLGQVKPPVATSDEIAKSGLEIVKASQLESLQKCGKIASNTLERCLICLDEYEPEDEVRLMKCRHFFHQGCVDRWMQQGKNNCPACRSKGVTTAGDAMEGAAAAAAASPTFETPAMSPA